ncbi:MAG: hypothetical protein FD123_1020 [Bacteroidetes bacterium]|nr:MAG: hypothetical protein FD123_1020 [Bacteroidota bacterium]
MRGILELNYRKKNIFLAREMWKGNPNFHALSEEKRKSIRLLMGHQGFGLHKHIGNRSFEYFTLLREPVDRIISLYYHILRFPDHHFAKEMAEKKYTLKELIDQKVSLPFDNCQVRMLSGQMQVPFGELNETHLELAIKNLEMYFPLAGLQNRFDEFVLLLSDRYGWKLPYYRRLKVSGNRVKKNELDAATIEAIRSCNQLDEKLIAHVSTRFEAQLTGLGEPFAKRVKRYRRINSIFAKTMNAIPFFKKPEE